MITKLRVSNYKSLGENVEIAFGQLNVLVGANGSGKSNVLDVLNFVADAVYDGLPVAFRRRGGVNAVLRRAAGHSLPLSIHIEVANGVWSEGVRGVSGDWTGVFGFRIEPDKASSYRVTEEYFALDGERQDRDFSSKGADSSTLEFTRVGWEERWNVLRMGLQNVSRYHIEPRQLRQVRKRDSAAFLAVDGANWATVIESLRIGGEWRFDDLVGGIKALAKGVSDVRVATLGENLLVQFQREDVAGTGGWCDAAEESDGTLRVAGIMTALLQHPAPSLVAVEEPELYVHPGALGLVYGYLDQAGYSSQVIWTTHSPELLDCTDVDKVKVWVVFREDGATRVVPASRVSLDVVRDKLLKLGQEFWSGGLEDTAIGAYQDAKEQH